jgi:hypothetical protein
MPGGDLATRFPERMLYGILPEDEILSLLAIRGWSDVELGVLKRQVATGFAVGGEEQGIDFPNSCYFHARLVSCHFDIAD